MHNPNNRGITLIELIVSILVVSIALVGVLSVMNLTTVKSPDPMVREQAVAIAEAYLEEILLRPFSDPDGLPDSGGRPGYDDVSDYHGLVNVGARDQNNTLVGSLGGYTVTVSVTNQAFNGIPAADSKRVVVTVTDAGGGTFSLVGYRTNY